MRNPILASLLMVLGACSPLPPQDARVQMDSLAARRDTAGLAELGRRQCKQGDVDERQACLEDYFLALASGHRVGLALGALERLSRGDEDVIREGHGFTHVIGIKAWQPGDDVAAVFRSCTGLFQSGCYHGVIQSYLTAEGGVDSLRAVELCDKVAAAPEDRWLRFQCVHGLGHGFEMAFAWELPAALTGCDWLPSSWDRESCYGGAFMENAVASQPGRHHTSARALAAAAEDTAAARPDSTTTPAAHGGHHAPDPAAITFRMRDSSEALYPCTIVGSRYLRSCYQVQGGIILTATGQDFEKAMTQCDRVDTVHRRECYLSLGTNASGASAQSTPKAIEFCSQGDPAYQPWCFVGVVKNFIDVTAQAADGIRFCREVAVGENRRACWNAVGEQIGTLYPIDPARRSSECAQVPGDEARICRVGARLP